MAPNNRLWLRLLFLAAVSSASQTGLSLAQTTGPPQSNPRRATEQENVADLFEMVSPAVVQITATNGLGKAVATGSGFVIASKDPGQCTIATNYHVIEPACNAKVTFANGQVGVVSAVIAADEQSDLAILQVTSRGNVLPTATIDLTSLDSPRVGTRIIVIGNPKGLTNSLSDGVVSGYRERVAGSNWLQITAPISPGSSGGPVFTQQGQLVGIATASIADGQNLNLAIPITDLRELLAKGGTPRALCKGASVNFEEDEAFKWIFENVYSRFSSARKSSVPKARMWALIRFGIASDDSREFCAYRDQLASESNVLALLLKTWRELDWPSPELIKEGKVERTVDELLRIASKGTARERSLAFFSAGKAYLKLRQAHVDRLSELIETGDRLGGELYVRLFRHSPQPIAATEYRIDPSDNLVCREMKKEYGDYIKIGESAETLLRKSYDADPSFAPTVERLVFIYSDIVTHPQALVWADKLVELVPRCASAYTLRGNIHVYFGRLNKAVDDLRRAFDLNPLSLHGAGSLAELHLSLGKYRDALEVLEPVIKRSRDDTLQKSSRADLLPLLGQTYCALGRCVEAAALFRDALQEADDRSRPYIRTKLAKCLEQCQD